jgi:hypothetical protein
MAKQIAKLLKATIQDSSDLKQIAKQLAGKGRGGDSMLVHITPREATMLKEAGGAGTVNPDTGLMEFYDGDADTYFTPSRSRSVDTDTYFTPRQAPTVEADTYFSPSRARNVSDTSYFASPTPSTPAVELPSVSPTSQFNVGYGRPETGRLRTDPQQLMPGAFGLAPAAPALPDTSALTPSFRGATPTYSDELVQRALSREPTFADRLRSAATSPRTLESLGLMGISAIPGILQAQQAREQGQRARQEMQAMASPYRQRGQELLASAQAGELTPQEQQQLQAMQARMAQGVAGRGGVGADQAANQLEAFRQQLLANKYDLGLKVSGIADQIATGAIKAGLEADQYVNELTSNYFSNAMQMAMMNMGQRPQGA